MQDLKKFKEQIIAQFDLYQDLFNINKEIPCGILPVG